MDPRPATVSSIIFWAELGEPDSWSTDQHGASVTWLTGLKKMAVSIHIPHWGPARSGRAYECFAETHEPFVTTSLDEAVEWLQRRAAENP